MTVMPQARTLAVFTKNRVNPAYAAARLAADRVAAEAGARTMHYVPETPDDVSQQKVLVGEALANRPDAVVFVPTDDAAIRGGRHSGGQLRQSHGGPVRELR